jgi:O-antigen/teichoic acid export membrane protein
MSDRARHALRGIAGSYLNFAASFAVSLIFTPISVAFLGPAAFGLWKTLAGSLTQYLQLIEFGLAGASIRAIAEARSRGDNHQLSAQASTVAGIYGLLALIGIALSAALAYLLGPLLRIPPELLGPGRLTMLLLGGNLAMIFLLTPMIALIAGHERYDIINILGLITTIASPLLGIVLLWQGFGLAALALGSMLAMVLSTLAGWRVARTMFPQVQIAPRLFSAALARKTLRFGGLVFLLNSGTLLITSSDNLVIARVLGVAAVAPYAIAYTLGAIALQLVFRVADVLLPVFTDLHTRGDLAALRRFYPQLLRFSTAVACALALAVVFVGPAFIRAWVPDVPFVGVPTLALIAAFAVLHGALVHSSQVTLQGIGQVRAAALATLAEAALNIVLSVLLARRMGLAGVALGSVLGQLLISAWYLPYLSARGIGMSLGQLFAEALPRPLLAALPAALLAATITAYPLAELLPPGGAGRALGVGAAALQGLAIVGGYMGLFYLLASDNDRRFVWQKLRTALVR